MKFVNTLNRVIIVIVCLASIAALTALFLLPQIVLVAVGQWMLDWGGYIQRMDHWLRLSVSVALTVIIDIALTIVIIIEVRRPRNRLLRVQQIAGGIANISTGSVVELLQHRLDPLPGIIRVTPRIGAKGSRVTAWVDAGVARGSNVPQTANRLIEVIKSVLTEELGLQIAGQPEVQVTVVQPPAAEPAGSAAAASASAPAPADPPQPPALDWNGDWERDKA